VRDARGEVIQKGVHRRGPRPRAPAHGVPYAHSSTHVAALQGDLPIVIHPRHHPSLGRSDPGERVKTHASADHNHPTMALAAGTIVVSDSDALGGNGQWPGPEGRLRDT
jgi:hypothetical protein